MFRVSLFHGGEKLKTNIFPATAGDWQFLLSQYTKKEINRNTLKHVPRPLKLAMLLYFHSNSIYTLNCTYKDSNISIMVVDYFVLLWSYFWI